MLLSKPIAQPKPRPGALDRADRRKAREARGPGGEPQGQGAQRRPV